MTSRGRGLLLTALLAALLAPPAPAKEVPFLSGRVNDQAELVSADGEARIESRLGELEKATGAQVAILTVASLEGEPLEDYTHRVAETWKLGRGKFDDGALLFVASEDRKLRLEVGYGLEEVLPDAIARRILDDVVRPRFKAGEFGEGIEAGVKLVADTIEGKGTLPPPSDSDGGQSSPAGFVLFAVFFLGLLVPFSMAAVSTKGFPGWFLYLFLTPFWGGLPAAMLAPLAGAVAAVLWLLGFPFLRWWFMSSETGKKWLARQSSGGSWSSRGGWGGGGWSSGGGGGWSGGSSGGGFSGGGGSFGGGGASSSW